MIYEDLETVFFEMKSKFLKGLIMVYICANFSGCSMSLSKVMTKVCNFALPT